MYGMTATYRSRPDVAPDDELRDQIRRDGFAFVSAAQMQALIAAPGRPAALRDDWPRFVSSWNDLVLDPYLPEARGFRRRRHATLSARAGQTRTRIELHQPHYQSLDYNPLLGGIERWFEPIEPDVLEGSS